MSDELLRPFRDKLRGRPPGPRPGEPPAAPPGDEAPADSIHIREVRVGLFPEVSPLHPGFVPGLPRVRMTIDLGADLRGTSFPLSPEGREALLGLCPRLLEHDCGDGDGIRRLLEDGARAAPETAVAPEETDPRDGLAAAHLIEHVAIEILVGILGLRRCSGLTCAVRERLDRFDIFLESPDPLAGRAAVILAAAVVRDLRLRRDARMTLHRRCRDLLALLASSRAASLVAEDTASRLGCGPDEALQVLEELVRLGYLAAVPSLLLFSSATGVLFRRAEIPATSRGL
ncbi:MAG TPA: hypothetical protein VEW47_16510 [Candidatus Dormibacteraeota bacterium]|nr:hypothetical protein [Candidatus Dormibacteraeota bacterium]